MRAQRGVATVLAAVCVTLLAGYAPTVEKSLGISADDVASVEYDKYPTERTVDGG